MDPIDRTALVAVIAFIAIFPVAWVIGWLLYRRPRRNAQRRADAIVERIREAAPPYRPNRIRPAPSPGRSEGFATARRRDDADWPGMPTGNAFSAAPIDRDAALHRVDRGDS